VPPLPTHRSYSVRDTISLLIRYLLRIDLVGYSLQGIL